MSFPRFASPKPCAEAGLRRDDKRMEQVAELYINMFVIRRNLPKRADLYAVESCGRGGKNDAERRRRWHFRELQILWKII